MMLGGLRQSRLNPFHHPITFSITTEDHIVVEKALALRGGETVLCIASSGDTPLNLLALGAGRVDAVDMSFPQLCLAALKAEGLRQLPLDEFHRLLGVVRDPAGAIAGYERIRGSLAADVRGFWDDHRYMIRRGVLWEGGLTRFVAATRGLLHLALGADGMDALARLAGPDEARAFGERYLESLRFQLVFRLAVNRLTYSLFYPGRGFEHLPPGMSPGEFSLEKVRQILNSAGIAMNPYLFPLIFGRYPSSDCVPPYLSARASPVIRDRLDRLHWIHAELLASLRAAPPSSVDAFLLCNVVGWLSASQVAALFAEVARVGRPAARVLAFSRSLALADHPQLPAALRPDRALSEQLSVEDRTAYHRSATVFTVDRAAATA